MERAFYVIWSHSSPHTSTSRSTESKPLEMGPGRTDHFPISPTHNSEPWSFAERRGQPKQQNNPKDAAGQIRKKVRLSGKPSTVHLTKKTFSEVLCQLDGQLLDSRIRSKSKRRIPEDKAMNRQGPRFMMGAQRHKAVRLRAHIMQPATARAGGTRRLVSYNRAHTQCHENSKER